MCDGFTAVAAGMAIASAAYGAYSSSQQADAAEEAGERNARLSETQAADARERGSLEGSRIRSAAVRMASRQKAAMLAQGITGAGVADVVEGTIEMGGTDAETARSNGFREGWGYQNIADTSRYEGRTAARQANANAVGSILGGIATVASLGAGGMQRAAAARAATGGGAGALTTTGQTMDFRLKPMTKVPINYTGW